MNRPDTEGPAAACPPQEPAHAATIRCMLEDAPPFRPEATPEALVAAFATGADRMPAFLALYRRGTAALPAIRAGFRHADANIRRWCVILADNFADAETLHALVPLLQDPHADVRRWAVHSLACETCKDGPNPIDAVPLLLERLTEDSSLRVRRQAAAMLAHHRSPDARVRPLFEQILATTTDRKLRLHAEQGLQRYTSEGC